MGSPATPTAWSYSRYSAWENCPAAYRYRYIDKLPEPKSEALLRGDQVHKQISAYLEGKADEPATVVARHFGSAMAELKGFPDKLVEEQVAFTREWKPTTWFHKSVWLRVIWDAAILYEDLTGEVIDHKTGKKYGTNESQMELFAVSFVARYPLAKHVTTRLWYLDSGDEVIAEFPAADMPKLKAKWESKSEAMLSDEVLAPRPGPLCRFCHFSRSNAGPCRFG